MNNSYSIQMLTALEKEDLPGAQVALQEALAHDDDDVLFQLGDQLVQIGFLEEAKEVFAKLLTRYPGNEEVLLALAEIAVEDDQIDEAFNLSLIHI